MAVDQDKLREFLSRFVGDLGATMAAGNVAVGDRMGLDRAPAGNLTPLGRSTTRFSPFLCVQTDPPRAPLWTPSQREGYP